MAGLYIGPNRKTSEKVGKFVGVGREKSTEERRLFFFSFCEKKKKKKKLETC